MDLISDNFISYDDSFIVKQEKLSDPDISIPSPVSAASESTGVCPITIPPTLEKFLNSTDSLGLYAAGFGNQVQPKKYRPFIIIRAKKQEPAESIPIKFEDQEKILSRSKRILKRAKAKQRNQLKQEFIPPVSPTTSKYTSEAYNENTGEDKNKKKMIQMIRNRISAQNSRDRKKNYVVQLEYSKNRLADENEKLINDKNKLMKEIKKLEESQATMLKENQMLKNNKIAQCTLCKGVAKGQEKGFLSTEAFAKSIEELASLILSKAQSCPNKNLFNDIFSFATFISFLFLSNQQKNNTTEDLTNLEDIRKLAYQSLEKLISTEQKGEKSFLINYLNNLCFSKGDFNSGFEEFLQLYQSQAETNTGEPSCLSHPSEFIKVEECDSQHGTQNYLPKAGILFGQRDLFKGSQDYCVQSARNNSQKDDNLAFFPPLFKCPDEDLKDMNLENENDDSASFHGYLMSSPQSKRSNKAANNKGGDLDLLQFFATRHLTFGGPNGEDGMLECE